MFWLKIFVLVQTFRQGPPVPSHNFCHPATQILSRFCLSLGYESRKSWNFIGLCVVDQGFPRTSHTCLVIQSLSDKRGWCHSPMSSFVIMCTQWAAPFFLPFCKKAVSCETLLKKSPQKFSSLYKRGWCRSLLCDHVYTYQSDHRKKRR